MKKEGAEMIFTHVLEMLRSDRATGEIKIGNTSYSYKQFAVSSLKTKYSLRRNDNGFRH